MVVLNLSPEASKAPEFLKSQLRAALQSTMDLAGQDSDTVVEVTSIVYNAADRRANMVGRIMPALGLVHLDFKVESGAEMQKVGDVCESCRKRWEKLDREPKVLQRARAATSNKCLVVPLCPFCDGDALEISGSNS